MEENSNKKTNLRQPLQFSDEQKLSSYVSPESKRSESKNAEIKKEPQPTPQKPESKNQDPGYSIIDTSGSKEQPHSTVSSQVNANNNDANNGAIQTPKKAKYKNMDEPKISSPSSSKKSIDEDFNNKALTDEQIWNELFGYAKTEFLPWSDLEEKVKPNPNYESIVYKEDGQSYFNIDSEALNILVPYIKHRDNVSRSGFIKLFSWFSPIKVRTSKVEPMECWKLEYLLETLSLEYFFGFEDSTSLEKKLSEEQAGTFLVRFSAKTIGGYAIMAKHGNVVSWKIDPNPRCFLTMPCSQRASYMSIKDVVEIHQTEPMPKVQISLKYPLSKYKKAPRKSPSKYKN